MEIEDVILFQIDQTNKIAKQYSQRELDALGVNITVEQWILLKIVSENDGLSQKELADRSRRDPASITRTLDLLEKKKYIQRLPIEGNRRAYALELTAVGENFIAEHMHLINEQRQLSIKGFSKKELHQLSSFLLKIQQNMK